MALSSKTCTKCKHTKPICDFYTTGKRVDGTPKYNSWCKLCTKDKMASYHKRTWNESGKSRTAYTRTKSVRSYLSYLRSKAVGRAGDCATLDDLVHIWNNQHGHCALTGVEMTFTLGDGVVATNCSIDRIDSTLRYTKDNIQLVCRAANIAKSDLTMEDFVNLCKAVVENHNAKNTCVAT